ncbi:homoserine O-acetyltransferase [soil metagenome]
MVQVASSPIGPVKTQWHTLDGPYTLQGGQTLPEVTLAYEQYGEISEAADNVILVFHALTGSQHAAGWNEGVSGLRGVEWTEECQLGWWDAFIGPGRALDTDRFAVMCVNYLGGCYGSTGPSSPDPATGEPYGSAFPELTLTDLVDVQMQLLAELGIDRLHAVVGGSVGGLMCIVTATRYPDRVEVVVPIAAGLGVTSLQVIHNFEQMFAIVSDPNFTGGDYSETRGPELGLALARMIGHKTFVSVEAMRDRARREVVQHEDLGGYQVGHPLESYMLHQGKKFVRRFDANTYLRVMEVWQRFDLADQVGAPVPDLLTRCRDQHWLLLTIDSDVCFYPDEQEAMAKELRVAQVPHLWFTVHSDKGHDSFLIEPWLYSALLREAFDNL